MPLRERLYKYDQSVVKILGTEKNKKIKIITMKTLRTAGLDFFEEEHNYKSANLVRGSINENKLEQSISRTKNSIYELAFCNEWEYFFTATLDKEKYPRDNLKLFRKNLTQYIRDQNKIHNYNIKYLLIPELHQDGKSWHMHGFLSGLPPEQLKKFKIGDKMGKKIAEKVKQGEEVFSWIGYSKKFGFCDLEKIKDHDSVSKYVMKYITKELGKCVTALNENMYFHSQGLNKAKIVAKGTMSLNIAPNFVGEYCCISELPYSDKMLSKILNNISS